MHIQEMISAPPSVRGGRRTPWSAASRPATTAPTPAQRARTTAWART